MSEDGDGISNELNAGVVIGQTILGRDITLVLPPQVKPALWSLPEASPAFVGRQDALDELLEALEPGNAADDGNGPAVVVTAVGGLAGVGKTELAVQAAHTARARGWFPGGVLFADLFGYDDDRRRDAGDVLEGMLSALGVPGEHIPAHCEDRSRMFTSVLAEFAAQGRPVLVVVDNVAGGDEARLLLPTDGVSAAIVTSRHTLAMLNARLLDLDVLDPGGAVAMLDGTVRMLRRRDRSVRADPAGAAQLAEVCGRLPLALRIAAALLASDPGQTPAALARELREEQPLEGLAFERDGVRRAFDLSYRALTDVQKRLFRLLTVNPGPGVSTEAAAALAGVSPGNVRTVLRELARAHLVERGTAPGWWRMHDLVRQYATDLGIAHAAGDERKPALVRLLDYYVRTTLAAGSHLRPNAADRDAGAFTDRADALAWLDAHFANLIAVTRLASTDPVLMPIALLPGVMTEFLLFRRHFNDWIGMARTALSAARSLGDRAGQADALRGLGIALYEVHRFDEAVTALQDSATIYREIGDRRREAGALNSLGPALRGAQRLEESITALQNAADIFDEFGDHHGEGPALTNLGLTLWDMNELEKSITALRKAADVFRKTGNRHAEGQALTNLGAVLRDGQRSGEAITTLQHAIAICRESGDRHSEAGARGNLGTALTRIGRFEEAVAAHQDAIAAFNETGDRRGEGDAHHNLGSTLAAMGHLKEAITAQRDAIAIYSAVGDRRNMAMTFRTLAVMLAKADSAESALTACREAISLFEETGDARGLDKARATLASLQEESGDHR
ncbi:tetratricopeptide repeat protein [Actinomadura sp. 3N407]|uniref:tetratricopeptide repeat protein n=1 Tax=Actinomadura sp. 3N407 TaxID=3457423 RepID=UPI003FCE145B